MPLHIAAKRLLRNKHLTAAGFEPTQLALVELESTPLDHSGKLSWLPCSATAAGDPDRRGSSHWRLRTHARLPQLSWLEREAVNLKVGSSSLPGSGFATATDLVGRPCTKRLGLVQMVRWPNG